MGQAARILLHRPQAPHHAAGKQQVNEKGAQRAQNPADDHGAKQAVASLIALKPRLCREAFLVCAEQRHTGLKIAHYRSSALIQRVCRGVPRTLIAQLFQDPYLVGSEALDPG